MGLFIYGFVQCVKLYPLRNTINHRSNTQITCVLVTKRHYSTILFRLLFDIRSHSLAANLALISTKRAQHRANTRFFSAIKHAYRHSNQAVFENETKAKDSVKEKDICQKDALKLT